MSEARWRTRPDACRSADGVARREQHVANLTAILDRDTVLQEATRLLTTDYEFDCAWFAEHDASADAVVIKKHSGMLSNAAYGLKLRHGRGLGGKVYALQKIQWVDEYFTSRDITHHYDNTVRSESLNRIIGAPICAGDAFVGVVMAGTRDGETFGGQAAAAMEMFTKRVAEALVVADAARAKVAQAIDAQRATMASQLHDTVGSILFSIAAGVQSAWRGTADPDVRDQLAAIEQRTQRCAETLRDSLRTLQTSDEEIAWGSAMLRVLGEFEECLSAKAVGAAPVHEPSRPVIRRREYEVLRHVAMGRTNQEIAVQMRLSEHTVKSYLRNLMHRLEARNRIEAISRARQAGLL
jgi:DNA-binding CsgD family transcriptional regulator